MERNRPLGGCDNPFLEALESSLASACIDTLTKSEVNQIIIFGCLQVLR